MKFGPAIGAGIVAGLIGAAIWAAIAYYANMEIGWVAWGIGALVGIAMAAVAQQTGPALGAAAVVITILSIVGGKYASVQVALSAALGDDSEIFAAYESEEFLITFLADEEVVRQQQNGGIINWPAGVDPEMAEKESDYPPNIWQNARKKWVAMTPENQAQFKQDRLAEGKANLAAFSDTLAGEAFSESFGAMDIIFFGLAVFTAFRLAGSESA